MDNILSVGVVFGEDQGLGNLGSSGENILKKVLLECFNNRPDLIRGTTSRSS